MVGGPSWRSVSGRGTLPLVQNWSGDSPGGREVVGGPSWWSRIDRATLSKVRKWSGRPSRRSGSGRGTFAEAWKWSRDLNGGPELVKESSQRSGSGRETLPEIHNF